MLAIERRSSILAKLSTEGKIIVSDLSSAFGVTEETIRRDIDKLAKEGLATKTYGGAIAATTSTSDLPYNVRKGVNVELKQNIAEKIANMINDGDRIMLDASSTAIYIIRRIRNKKNITVITNSVEILIELADKTGWTILSTGGALKEGSFSMVGLSAERMVRGYHVDFCICSAKGIDKRLGITDSNEKDSEMKQAMFASADKRILALDSTKFDKKSFVKVCNINEIDMIVTDKDPGQDWAAAIGNSGVDLIY